MITKGKGTTVENEPTRFFDQDPERAAELTAKHGKPEPLWSYWLDAFIKIGPAVALTWFGTLAGVYFLVLTIHELGQ